MRSCERVHKFWLVASVVATALLYVMFAIYFDMSLEPWQLSKWSFASEISGSNNPSRLNKTTKKILFWNTMFGDETFYFGKGNIFKNCPDVSANCWATHDRSIANIEDFDALLFHGSDLSLLDEPSKRLTRQRYVFVNLESPENRPVPYLRYEDNYFNLTMTYRLDSDVVWSYANIRDLENGNVVAPSRNVVWNTRFSEATGKPNQASGGNVKPKKKKKIRKTGNKTKTAVWFVSNCRSRSGREKYIEELAKHVDVDIFGLCGQNIRCPKDRDCFPEVVEPDYYFYLSFENSMCQDYVTEKLYNALKYDVVPVVYGGANYSFFAPPNSYINALDFASPKHLADYLLKLRHEPSEYNKFFEWKERYEVVDSKNQAICQLCQLLHDNPKPKSYSPLTAWYKSDKCPLQNALENFPYLSKNNYKFR